MPENLNLFWCRAVAAELRRAGVRHAVLTQGGRSAAMSLALLDDPNFDCYTRLDERGAAFLALGIARSTDRPVAVVTTSGSAVANLLPALTEAAAWGTPLVLVTCDRPLDVRANAGPQTSDHMGLCASMVAAAVDLPMPDEAPAAIARLRAELAEVLRPALPGPGRGVVQINLPLAGRLTSLDEEPGWRAPAAPPGPDAPFSAPTPPEAEVAPLLAALAARPGLRGLIVAGAEPSVPLEWIAEFAATTGFPLLADAPSGLRRPAAPNLVTLGDILAMTLGGAAPPPELIVEVGGTPVSNVLQAYLSRHDVPVLRISRRPVKAEQLPVAPHVLVTPRRSALRQVAGALAPGDAAWRNLWLAAEADAETRRAAALKIAGWGDAQAAAVACAAQGFDLTLLANSMPARLGNLFCTPSAQAHPIVCSRGVNGIDGTLSTFFGTLIGHGGRGLAILGDQAMLHDLPSLEALPERRLQGCICLFNNKGPGIFDLSIWPENPALRERMRRRTSVDFGAVAAGFGLAYERVGDAAALQAALARAAVRDSLSLVEADLPEDALSERFRDAVRCWLGLAG